jgi:hypothetical protein
VTGRCSRCYRKLAKRFERLEDGRLAMITGGPCGQCRRAERERAEKAKLLEECRHGGRWSSP